MIYVLTLVLFYVIRRVSRQKSHIVRTRIPWCMHTPDYAVLPVIFRIIKVIVRERGVGFPSPLIVMSGESYVKN